MHLSQLINISKNKCTSIYKGINYYHKIMFEIEVYQIKKLNKYSNALINGIDVRKREKNM